jgi:hypothetical protein
VAITKTFNSNDLENIYGITFNDAYYRIVRASVMRAFQENPEKFQASITVLGYAASNPPIDFREINTKEYRVDYENIKAMSGSDFIQKCYQWVLTQPEFEGATSV